MKLLKKVLSITLASLLMLGCTNKGSDDTMKRKGSSYQTLKTPDDFPKEYNYGSGKITDMTYEMMYKKLPLPENEETVLNTKPDLTKIQALYLWEKEKMPTVTTFNSDREGYFDDFTFRPYVTAIPVKKGTKVKGAVVLLAGGAFQFRGNYGDTLPTAAHLRKRGYQTFIVDYRLTPYTMQEGAIDVARAVRFIRKHASLYQIDPDCIAVMGYSAGGIQAGEFLLNFDEEINGSILDSSYVPDELDYEKAHVSACGMIYSFYGRLSVASLDKDKLLKGNLPPTFYCYGTRDPFYDQFEKQYDLMQDIKLETKRIVLQDWPHGFGGDGDWIEDYDKWLEDIFSNIRR